MTKKDILHIFLISVTLATTLIIQSTYPIIIGGTIWYNPQTNQTVSCLSDMHVFEGLHQLTQAGHNQTLLKQKFAPLIITNSQQQTQLDSALKKLTPDKSLILAEDLGSDTNNQSLLAKIPDNEILFGIIQKSINNNIPVINIECRQNKAFICCQITSKQNMHLMDTFVRNSEYETDSTIQEIKDYKSGFFLHMYNTNALAEYTVLRKKFMETAEKTKTYDIIEAMHRDCILLDLKALNYIKTQQNKTQMILFAGFMHTSHVESVLPLLGYKKIYENGYSSKNAVAELNSIKLTDPTIIDIFTNVHDKTKTFNITDFLDITQNIHKQATALSANKPKPIYSHLDRMFIEIVRKNARRFPFCFFVPLIIQCLKTNRNFCSIIRL